MSATHGHASTNEAAPLSGPLSAVARWLTAADHLRIGLSLMFGALLWLLLAAGVGAILGLERFDASSALVEAGAHTQLFSMHRFALVFGVVAPLMLGVCVWTLPTQLHASNISLPRLAAFGWWAWCAGSITVLVSYLANGGPGGGAQTYVETYLLGLGMVVVGLVAVAISIVATVMTRRNGRRIMEIPVGAFSALVGAMAIILTVPVAVGTIAYLWVDYVNARVAFGGGSFINSWVGWMMREPHTLLFVVPALGVLADTAVRVARARQPLLGVMLVGVGLSASVVMSSVTQQAHVFSIESSSTETLRSLVPYALFNVLPLLAPVVVILLSLLALRAGKPRLAGAYVAAFLGVGMILTGALGSAVMHVESAGLLNTVFAEATTVYVVYGAVITTIGAVALHSGSITGRALPDTPVVLLALVAFAATVLAALPHYIAGFLDQPNATAGGFDDGGFVAIANLAVALGHALMILVVVAFVGLVARSRRGEAVRDVYAREAAI